MRALVALLALALVASGCDGSASSEEDAVQTAAPSASATPTSSPTPPPPGPAERLGLAEGWGPSVAELDAATRKVRRLSVPELAGQVIVAAYDGTAAPTALVRRLGLGGVIAFSDNITGTSQIRGVNRRLQRSRPHGWPLLTSIDQEGGTVERVKGEATRFPTFMSAGAARDADLTERAYAASGAELTGLGFVVDYAPVADVTSGPDDPTIGARSAGSDPDLVATQATAAARGFWSGGVIPVLKHFPGHGSVPADSHKTLPVQTKTLKQLKAVDLVPFEAAIDAGLPAIMVGHIDVRAVDPGVPSSVSRPVVTGLLRERLGFDGLVVTDALDMAGVAGRYGPGRSAVMALRAGVDVLLMPPDPAVARAAIVQAVRKGDLPRSRLRQAATRMVALLLHHRDAAATGKAPGSGRAASRALSAAAITSAAGPCAGRLVAGRIVASGDSDAVAAFVPAGTAGGLTVLTRRTPPADLTRVEPRPPRKAGQSKKAHRRAVRRWRQRERRRRADLDAWQSAEDQRLAGAATVVLTRTAGATADVVVAVDTPYVLGRSRAPVKLATYGVTPGAMTALVAFLTGQATAPGRLPVAVPGVRRGCGA